MDHNNQNENPNRRSVQIAGDKSGERSIVDSILEDDDQELFDDELQSQYVISEADEEESENGDVTDEDDNDDDLSETVYEEDENDQSMTYTSQQGNFIDNDNDFDNGTLTSMGPFSDDGDIDNVIDNGDDFEEHQHRNRHDEESSVVRRNDGESEYNNDNDLEESEAMDMTQSVTNSNANLIHWRHRHQQQQQYLLQEAEETLQRLIQQYNGQQLNPTLVQYQQALEQISSKWEQIYEQTTYEHEQQIEVIVQERQDLELEIHEMERLHRDELDNAKQQVMEQSQKIIMQEMKANADRERKSEVTIDLAVKQAVNETKQQMNEEFEIALKGMTDAQQELENRYQNIIKETEIRVIDEMREQMNKGVEEKVNIFKENYNHLKQQVLDLTMELEKTKFDNEYAATNNTLIDDTALQERDDEIEQLNKTIKLKNQEILNLRSNNEQQIQSIQASIQKEKALLTNKIAVFQESLKREYDDNLQEEIEKAIHQTKVDMNKDFDVTLKDLKSKYKKLEQSYLKEKIEELKESHEAQLSQLNQVISEKDQELARKDKDHDDSLKDAIDKIQQNLEYKYEEKIKALECRLEENDRDTRALYEQQILYLQEKYEDEKNDLVESNKKMQLIIADDERKLNEAGDAHKKEMDSLRLAQNQQMNDMKKSHSEEISSIMDSIRLETNSIQESHNQVTNKFQETIDMLKKEHHTDLEQMKTKYVKTTKALQTELDLLRSQNETLKTTCDKQMSPSIATHSAISVEDCKQHSVASTDVNNEISAPQSLARTPRRNQKIEDNNFDDLSPLTIGSPSPGIKTRKKSESCDNIFTPSRSKLESRRTGQTSRMTKIKSRHSTLPSSSRVGTVNTSSTSIPGKKVIYQSSPKRRSVSRTLFGDTGTPETMNSKMSTSTTLKKIVDKTPNKMRQTSSLIGSARRAETTRMNAEDIRLMIMNVPVHDRMMKIAKMLNIQIINDPLKATHVIIGDNKIKRTAKFMTVLNVTSNILKPEWLEDCYKRKSLLSCSHYLLLNDSKAEELYSFSMKQTLIEGRERRLHGGLLAGWKILVCDDVAGNKAPKEEYLRLMIAAAGGDWLDGTDIPVPINKDPSHVIVITSDPVLQTQIEDEKASIAAENGAGFFTITWLFDCMMHQQLFGLRRGIGRT